MDSFWGWFILGLDYRPDTGGAAVLAYCKGPHMKTFLRLFGKFTRWYITSLSLWPAYCSLSPPRAIWLA
ncbi:hypothetical protein [Escherichia coli]|uniref:hypothetical protein n=1 Tax=Escherichia coli TaxID=562 RepID=UPI002147ED4D|nr:hypothetical protein [Escherichia coli]MCR1084569.1 hypothetical protein [Escherichia coli]